MYCGDETGSFVGEVTSSSSRFGYGGEDCPKAVYSSYMYRDGTIPTSTHRMPPNEQDVVPIFAPTPKLSYGTNRTNSSYNHPAALDPNQYMVNDGIIEHWDAWENVWHKAFLDLNVSTRDKHTKGITKVPMKKNPLLSSISSHASGVQSSFTSTKENRNDILSDEEIMHPILAIDSGHTNLTVDNHNVSGTGTKYQQSIQQKQRATMIEIMYESFHAPATFIAPSPMLAAFGNGRQTALVVDIGANGTRVTPIVEGMVLQQAQRRNGRGGEYISAVQEYVLKSKILKKDIVPRYIVRARGKNDENDYDGFMKKIKIGGFHQVQDSIFHQMALRDVMYEMKTSPHVEGVALYRHNEWTIPFLNHDEDYEDDEEMELVDESVMVMEGDVNENENGQERKGMQGNHAQKNFYQLPDGTVISLENKKVKDIKRLPELLFAAELPFLSSDEDTESKSDCLLHPTLSNLPLHELVKDSLSAVADADVKKELCGNIVLTGAASLCANIESRMSLEIQYLVPKIYRCKVIASRNTVERKFASWIGGSILSSLGSFQQLWLSKKEYEEYGMTLATERFP